MSFWLLATRSMLRNKVRTVLTLLAMALTLCAFVLLRTALAAYRSHAENASADRLSVRARGGGPLPLKHLELIRGLAGVRSVTYGVQMSATAPKKPTLRLPVGAVDASTTVEVFDEMLVPEEQRLQWVANRSGALIGDATADLLDAAVGDSLTLMLRGGLNVTVRVDGIYRVIDDSYVQRNFTLIHHELLNEMLPPHERDRVLFRVRAVDEAQAKLLTASITDAFERRGTSVDVDSERAQANVFLHRFGSLLYAIDVVSVGVLLLMLLIVSNTMAMTIRERTAEMGMLRAVGFRSYHLGLLVAAEAIVTALAASLLGMLLAYPLVAMGLPWLMAAVMQTLPARWPAEWGTYLLAAAATLVASVLGVAAPGYRAATMPVSVALRYVD